MVNVLCKLGLHVFDYDQKIYALRVCKRCGLRERLVFGDVPELLRWEKINDKRKAL